MSMRVSNRFNIAGVKLALIGVNTIKNIHGRVKFFLASRMVEGLLFEPKRPWPGLVAAFRPIPGQFQAVPSSWRNPAA
jgi:hypothetical protein